MSTFRRGFRDSDFEISQVGVIGSGPFGQAIAYLLAKDNPDLKVIVNVRSEEELLDLNKNRKLSFFEHSKMFPENISFSFEPEEVVKNSGALFCLLSVQDIRRIFQQKFGSLIVREIEDGRLKAVFNGSKGIERLTQKVPSQIFRDIFGKGFVKKYYSYFCGPNFAKDVVEKSPMIMRIAAKNEKIRHLGGKLLGLGNVTTYYSPDVRYSEYMSALKNCLAISCGMGAGLGLSESSMASLRELGKAEIRRFLKIFFPMRTRFLSFLEKISPENADLDMTIQSPHSRNYEYGFCRATNTIYSGDRGEAGGVETLRAVLILAKKRDVSMPIFEATGKVLFQGAKPQRVLPLLLRQLKKQNFDHISDRD